MKVEDAKWDSKNNKTSQDIRLVTSEHSIVLFNRRTGEAAEELAFQPTEISAFRK